MKNLDLEIKYIDFIKNTVSSILDDAEIYMFGSRTHGKATKYSDIDIALKLDKIIEIDEVLKIKSKFQDSTFPYKVDIIDLNSIDEKFFNIIKDDLIKIN